MRPSFWFRLRTAWQAFWLVLRSGDVPVALLWGHVEPVVVYGDPSVLTDAPPTVSALVEPPLLMEYRRRPPESIEDIRRAGLRAISRMAVAKPRLRRGK